MDKQFSGKPVTIYEIAERVGVSPAAVSSVLANREVQRRISATTAQKVRAAAREMGYVPNMAGRRLRSRQSVVRQYDLAIFTTFEAPLPLVSQALHAMQRAVDVQTNRDAVYSVTIEMFHAGRLRDKPAVQHSDRYHGVIITNTAPDDDEFLAEARLPYPVVLLGRRIPHYSCVVEAAGIVGRHAAEALHAAGCRRPAVLHGAQLTQTVRDRVESFARIVRERTGAECQTVVGAGLASYQAAAAVELAFTAGAQFDGLFAVTDSLAAGAYDALRRGGLGVPQDVAVVGVGDQEIAEYLSPALTTVAGANESLAAEAVPLLFRMLRGEVEGPREVVVVPPVFHRASTQRFAARG